MGLRVSYTRHRTGEYFHVAQLNASTIFGADVVNGNHWLMNRKSPLHERCAVCLVARFSFNYFFDYDINVFEGRFRAIRIVAGIKPRFCLVAQMFRREIRQEIPMRGLGRSI